MPSSSSTAKNEQSSPMSPSSRQRRSMSLTLSMRKPNHWYSPGASGSHSSRTRWARSCSSIGLRRTWSPPAQVLLTKRPGVPGERKELSHSVGAREPEGDLRSHTRRDRGGAQRAPHSPSGSRHLASKAPRDCRSRSFGGPNARTHPDHEMVVNRGHWRSTVVNRNRYLARETPEIRGSAP